MISIEEYQAAEEQYFEMPDKELATLAKLSAEEQPAIFAFLAVNLDYLEDEDNKDFFIQLIYSTWLVYKNKYTFNKVLRIEEIEEQDVAEETLLTNISENNEAMMEEVIKRITTHPQAQLIGYLYTLIGDFFGFDVELSEDDEIIEDYDPESGIISGAINSFISLLEKARNPISVV